MNNKIKKVMCALTACLLCISVNAAGAPEGEKKSGDLSLRFFLNLNNEEKAVYEYLLKEYEARTGVTISWTQESPDVYVGDLEKMTADFKDGRLHNFLYLYDRENPYDSGEIWSESLLEYTKDSMYISDKEIPGYPASTKAVRLLCNETLFEKTGAEFPNSWKELLEACEIFEDAGIEPFAFANASVEEPMWKWLVNTLANQMTGDLAGTLDVNEKDKGYVELEEFCKAVDKGTAAVGETAVTQVYAGLRELSAYFAEGSEAMSRQDAIELVAKGRAAVTLGTYEDVAEAAEKLLSDNESVDIRAIPIPVLEQEENGGASDSVYTGVLCGGEPEMIYGISTSVSKEDETFEAAVDFIQYMTSAQVQEQLAENPGIFPSNQKAVLPEGLSGFAVDEEEEKPMRIPFWAGVSETHGEAVWKLLSEYLSGECTDEELGERLTVSFRDGVKKVLEEKGWNLANNYGMPTAGECTMCEP